MTHSSRFDELLEAARDGRLTRRHVLARATALGLSAPAISMLIAACGGDDDDDDDDGDTGGGADPTATSAEAEPTEADDDDDAEPTEADDDDPEPTATEADDSASGEGVVGGTLRIAQIGEPATLD
ncbi:hypothetical protein BH23CHL2_BH23CHL2_26730 [soil metagenome]